jgi:hypothetical protein
VLGFGRVRRSLHSSSQGAFIIVHAAVRASVDGVNLEGKAIGTRQAESTYGQAV